MSRQSFFSKIKSLMNNFRMFCVLLSFRPQSNAKGHQLFSRVFLVILIKSFTYFPMVQFHIQMFRFQICPYSNVWLSTKFFQWGLPRSQAWSGEKVKVLQGLFILHRSVPSKTFSGARLGLSDFC